MSPRRLLRWLAVVLAMVGGLAWYVEVGAGPSVGRRVFIAVAWLASIVLLVAGQRAERALKTVSGRRLWRSGPLGRAWLGHRGRGVR